MKTDEPIRSKTIEEWRDSAEDNYLTTPISVLKYITVLEEQLSKQSEQSKWVEVRENSMPEFEEPVLVFCAIYGRYIATYVFIGEFDGVKYGNWHDGKQLGVLPPTHWQPLPTPPKNK